VRKFKMTLLLPLCLLAGCLSQSTKDDLANLGREVGQKVAQGLKDEGKQIAQEAKTAAFEGAKSAAATTIKNDAEIPQSTKDELLAQLAGAGGFAGIAGILVAYAKAKAAAKAKKALGIVVNAASELPTEALKTLRQEVAKTGGKHPAITALIEEVKS